MMTRSNRNWNQLITSNRQTDGKVWDERLMIIYLAAYTQIETKCSLSTMCLK